MNEWAERQGDDYFQTYWDSVDDPRRPLVAEGLAWLCPPGRPYTFLDLGCHVGPGLRAIHRQFPDATLYGADVNKAAIAYGQDRAATEGWRWHAVLADYESPSGQDIISRALGPVDVITTGYALAYVNPRRILPTLEWMQDLAQVGVVLAEPMQLLTSAALPCHPKQVQAWAHPYLRLFAASSRWQHQARDFREWPVFPVRDGLNWVLAARRSEYL